MEGDSCSDRTEADSAQLDARAASERPRSSQEWPEGFARQGSGGRRGLVSEQVGGINTAGSCHVTCKTANMGPGWGRLELLVHEGVLHLGRGRRWKRGICWQCSRGSSFSGSDESCKGPSRASDSWGGRLGLRRAERVPPCRAGGTDMWLTLTCPQGS